MGGWISTHTTTVGTRRICTWPVGLVHRGELVRTVRKVLADGGFIHVDKVVRRIRVATQRADGRSRIDVWVKLGFQNNALRALKTHTATRRWLSKLHQADRRKRGHGGGPEEDADAAKLESRDLRLVSWNIRGLNEKREELRIFARQKGADILCIQETLYSISAPYLSGYRCAHSLCGGTGRRGVAVFTREGLPVVEMGMSDDFSVWVRVLRRARPTVIASIYVPVQGEERKAALLSIKEKAQSILRRLPGVHLAMVGDWNMSRVKMDRMLARWACGLRVADVSGSDKTWHMNTKKKVIWTSIDHLVVSTRQPIKASLKVDRRQDISDHFPLVIKMASPLKTEADDGAEETERLVMKRHKLPGKYDQVRNSNRFAVLADEFAAMEVQDLPGGEGLESSNTAGSSEAEEDVTERNDEVRQTMEKLAAEFTEVCSTVAVEKRVAKRVNPASAADVRAQKLKPVVLSAETKVAVKQRRRIWGRMLEAIRADDRDQYVALLKEHRKALSKARELMKIDRRKEWTAFIQEGVDHLTEQRNHKLFWAWIKRLTGQKKRVAGLQPIRDAEGNLLLDPEKIAGEWMTHYGKLAKDVTGHSRDPEHWRSLLRGPRMEALDGINEVPSWGEVNACILGMNKNKAAGLSGLTPDFIALAGDIGPLQQAAEPESPFGETVFALVKAMFRHSIVPSCLNTALVVSIPKKGDKTQIDNYRGISLIEIVLKVAAGVVNRRVSEALEHNNRIVREQAGFRPNEECISQVVTLHETCTRRAALGLETYAAFIDFRKAFDTVCHEAVFAKLDHIGVRGRALGFVKALYKESGITVANAAGVRVRLERGVRQGCPLSPLLFNVFINDILDECRDLGVMVPGLPGGDNQIAGLLQADDLVLLAPSCEKLQQMLDKVTAWADRWQMSANGAKCGVMAFGDGAAAIAAAKSWSVQGETVPYVHTYRYLGVLVNDRLDVRAMVTDRAVHLEAACATLHSFLATTSIPMVARTKVLNAVAVAVAAYGGELWGMNQQMAQKLQSKLDETARWLLGASSRSRIASAMTVWKRSGLRRSMFD